MFDLWKTALFQVIKSFGTVSCLLLTLNLVNVELALSLQMYRYILNEWLSSFSVESIFVFTCSNSESQLATDNVLLNEQYFCYRVLAIHVRGQSTVC